MAKWLYITLLLSFFFVSCNQDRMNMIEEYNKLYQKVQAGALDSISLFLDEKSISFYDKITDPQLLELEQVINLGMEYKLPYFSVMYLASCGEHMKNAGKPTDFYRYLANRDISFFSKYNIYKVSEEKTKIGDEGFVAIYRNEGGANKMTWAKFTRPDEKTFKYDLLYNLKLEEKRNRAIYKEQREDKKDLDMRSFLKSFYDSYNNQNCDL